MKQRFPKNVDDFNGRIYIFRKSRRPSFRKSIAKELHWRTTDDLTSSIEDIIQGVWKGHDIPHRDLIVEAWLVVERSIGKFSLNPVYHWSVYFIMTDSLDILFDDFKKRKLHPKVRRYQTYMHTLFYGEVEKSKELKWEGLIDRYKVPPS